MKPTKRKSQRKKSNNNKFKSISKRKSTSKPTSKRRSTKPTSTKYKSTKPTSTKHKSTKPTSTKYKATKPTSTKHKLTTKRKSPRMIPQIYDGMDDDSPPTPTPTPLPLPTPLPTPLPLPTVIPLPPSLIPSLPTPSLTRPVSVIKLEPLIYNMQIYNSKALIATIATFNIFKKNTNPLFTLGTSTCDFIKQLFNFDKNGEKIIYINKEADLQHIILRGLYFEFETLLDNIDITTVKCSERDKEMFNKKSSSHLTKLNLSQNPFVVAFLNRFDPKEDKTLRNQVLKFLFYSACIQPITRKIIMRHYLLSFMKTSFFNDNITTNKIQLDYSIKGDDDDIEQKEEIINNFFVNIGAFKVIPFRYSFNYINPEGIKMIFSTCGETTLLNILNYFLINRDDDDDGTFDLDFINSTFSEPLKEFYRVFHNMKIQLADQPKTTKAWLDVVSNLPKKDIYFPKLKDSDNGGDIIPNKQNIEYVLKTILNSNVETVDFIDIVNQITTPGTRIEIIDDNKHIFKILIDNYIEVFFTNGHAEMNTKQVNYNNNNDMVWDDNGCQALYNIFSTMQADNIQELSLSITDYLLINNSIDSNNPTLDYFLSTIKTIDVRANLDYNNPFPSSIDKLTNLESLTIILNNPIASLISYLPDSIKSLIKLNRLIVNINDTPIPDWIGNLNNLIILDFSNCNLTSLPESLQSLVKLEVLSLNSNMITLLPEWIGNLTNLLQLFVMDNQIKDLPESIGNKLLQLEELDLSNNQITKLPPSYRNLTKLTFLNLESNAFSTLPYWLTNFEMLTELNIGNNQLKSLPLSIGGCVSLQRLLAGGNQLESLPPSICDLANLKVLNLDNNHLLRVPNDLGKLKSLIKLSLVKNQLSFLFHSIGDLKSLKELSVSYNKIRALPDSIGDLESLTKLNLFDNQLSELPNSIGNLKSLTQLDITNNQLSELPDSIGSLKSLEYLIVSNNKIFSLPDSIGDLESLTLLNLFNNQLSSIPDSIGNLSNLESLFLQKNNLTSLPLSISKLTKLHIFDLKNDLVDDDLLGLPEP